MREGKNLLKWSKQEESELGKRGFFAIAIHNYNHAQELKSLIQSKPIFNCLLKALTKYFKRPRAGKKISKRSL